MARVTKVRASDEEPTFHAAVQAICVECGERFKFKGVPVGFRPSRPTISADGLELRAPLEPSGEFDERVINRIEQAQAEADATDHH